jgi:hypothetical protein
MQLAVGLGGVEVKDPGQTAGGKSTLDQRGKRVGDFRIAQVALMKDAQHVLDASAGCLSEEVLGPDPLQVLTCGAAGIPRGEKGARVFQERASFDDAGGVELGGAGTVPGDQDPSVNIQVIECRSLWPSRHPGSRPGDAPHPNPLLSGERE